MLQSLALTGIQLYNAHMSQAFHLLQLQKIDTPLGQYNLRLSAIEAELLQNSVLQEALQARDASLAQLEAARKSIRKIEDQVQTLRIKIETSEASLYGGKIRNPKELQDLQMEIASLKRFLSELEDLQLDAMIKVEQSEADAVSAEKGLVAAQAQTTSQTAGLQGERATINTKIERMLIEREAILPQITPDNLATYQRLREQKRGLAVCQVEDGACKGCGSAVRPAEIQAARSPTILVRCSTCGRILYTG
jgi:uncharacterized protein